MNGLTLRPDSGFIIFMPGNTEDWFAVAVSLYRADAGRIFPGVVYLYVRYPTDVLGMRSVCFFSSARVTYRWLKVLGCPCSRVAEGARHATFAETIQLCEADPC